MATVARIAEDRILSKVPEHVVRVRSVYISISFIHS